MPNFKKVKKSLSVQVLDRDYPFGGTPEARRSLTRVSVSLSVGLSVIPSVLAGRQCRSVIPYWRGANYVKIRR